MSLRTTSARWRPALRMAWRDLRSHRLQSLVVIALVALPIAAAITVSTVASTTRYGSGNYLYSEYGTADLKLEVTQWPAIRASIDSDGGYVGWQQRRGLERGDRRVPSDVDVAALLPSGSTTMRTGTVGMPLTTGGSLDAEVLDLDSSLVSDLVPLEEGRAPRAADEVAVSATVADELAMLKPDGSLRPGATLPLLDGDTLRVVGVSDTSDSYYGLAAVVPPTSDLVGTSADDDLRGFVDPAPYLVGLPPMSVPEQQQLFDDLAAEGIVGNFRDAALHPADWGLEAPVPTPVDPTAVAVGALVIGLGLVEVLVLVGAVFAVSARRQGRTLGLLIASGGTAADVRRTLLAQGVWIGLAAAVVGVAGGTAALLTGRDLWGRIVGQRLFDYDVSIGTVLALAILGIGSAVLAAAIPAWGVGRMTASQALDGHVAAPTSKKRDLLRGPAIALVAVGVAGLTLCGFWIAATYAEQTNSVSAVPVVVAAFFALAALVGTALGIPSVVSWGARTTGHGWLPWRMATRDAARNRARTSAAVLAVGVVTTGAVFAGFGVSASNAYGGGTDRYLPPDTVSIYLDPSDVKDSGQLARVETTATDVVGADRFAARYDARSDGRAVTARRGDSVQIVDEAWLDIHQIPSQARAVVAAGGAIVNNPGAVRDGTIELRTGGKKRTTVAELDAVVVTLPWRSATGTWISLDTATRLGLTPRPTGDLLAHADGVTAQDADRLRLYGIFAQSEYEGDAPSQLLVYAGAAGTLALTALIVGMIVALSAAEGRSDAATLAAVGAPPWTRRAMSAAQALFVGGLGSGVGLLLGAAVGASTLQLIGTPGTPVPWAGLAIIVVGVPVLCAAVGWVVTPTRLSLTRRTG